MASSLFEILRLAETKGYKISIFFGRDLTLNAFCDFSIPIPIHLIWFIWLSTLPETNILVAPDKTIVSFWGLASWQVRTVSFREGNYSFHMRMLALSPGSKKNLRS